MATPKMSPRIVFSVSPQGDQPYTNKGHGIKTVLQRCRATDRKGEVLHGKVRVEALRDEFWGGPKSRKYVGPVLTDPTWGNLRSEARKAALRTGDLHHVFLEGAERVRKEGDVTIVHLLMGS